MSDNDASSTRREWARFHFAYAVSWPLWQVKRLGDACDEVQCRIVRWGERESRSGDSNTETIR